MAAMLSTEKPTEQATTMVLAASAYSLGAAGRAAPGGALLALGGYGALGPALPVLASGAVAPVWRRAGNTNLARRYLDHAVAGSRG